MLTTGKRDKGTAIQVILYSVWTVLVSLIPAFGVTGKLFLSPIAASIILMLGIGLLWYAFKLYRERSAKAAKKLMFASVSYITLLQLVYVFDKLIRQWL